jgi:glucose-6-phosphate-specific signal transduction histidine kinase
MTGILYAVAEIVIFMVAATIVGFLLGRATKRAGATPLHLEPNGDLADAQEAIRELESERAELRDQLHAAKERTRMLAAEVTSAEKSQDFATEKKRLAQQISELEAQADRLRATIAERDSRIASISAGEEPPQRPIESGSVGYSHSAGSFAETKIFFKEEDE